MFSGGLLSGQSGQPSDNAWESSFSTCKLTLKGSPSYSATVTKGLVQDVNKHQWALPSVVTIPKGGKITVTATSTLSGAITASPGQINQILTPTAGWISVTNASPAIPGKPIELRCHEALRNTAEHLSAYEGLYLTGGCLDCFTRLVPVYSDGKIGVYADQRSLEEAISFRIATNFAVHLYFVYTDDSIRQQAIESIERHSPIPPNHDKLQELKYVMMDVDYYERGIFGLATRDGRPVPGPALVVNGSVYLSPFGCEVSDYLMGLNKAPGYPSAETEIIRASPGGVGAETYEFIGESSSPHWSLLLGDLAPLRTNVGFKAVRVSREQTPFMFQVLMNVRQKIADGIASRRIK